MSNPFYTAGRVPAEKLIGRVRELEAIRDLLRSGHSIELVGPSQIGKSSLLAYLCATGEKALGEPARFHFLDLQGLRNEDDLWASLARELDLEPEDPRRALLAVARDRRVILCLDEVEKLLDFSADVWGHLRSLAQETSIELVLASRRPLDDFLPQGETSPLSNILTRLVLGGFSEEECRRLIEVYLAGTGIDFSDEEIAGVLKQAEGHPARLQELCRVLFADKVAATAPEGEETASDGESGEPAEADPPDFDYEPGGAFTSDTIARKDLLWNDVYAQALADFLDNEDTQPPLVIGIDAPWGGGKSTLMAALRRKIDGDGTAGDDPKPAAPGGLTLGGLWRRLRGDVTGSGAKLAPTDRPLTVWFNAWKYSRDEQLWAALMRTVIQQVTDRLGPLGREDFLLRLNLRRVDKEKVRRRIYRIFFNRLLPWLALQIVTLLVAAFELFTTETLFVLNAVPVLGMVFTWWSTKKKPLSIDLKLEGYVKAPPYEEKVGFLGEVQEDFRRLRQTIGEDRRLVIFVDDLDRCSPGKITELIEAINTFFGLEDSHCFFVLGIDASYVRAGIESAYGALRTALGEAGNGFGEQFLAKIVQVWLKIPELDDPARDAYLEALLGAKQPVEPVDEDEVEELREAIHKQAPGLDHLDAAAAKVAAEHPEVPRAVVDEAKREETVRRFTEKDPEVREILAEAVRELKRPRQVKLFLNRFRLEGLIRIRRGEARGREALRELALEVARELAGQG